MKIEVTMFVPFNQFNQPYTGRMVGEQLAYHLSKMGVVIENEAYWVHHRTSYWRSEDLADQDYRDAVERQMRHELMREIEKELFGV